MGLGLQACSAFDHDLLCPYLTLPHLQLADALSGLAKGVPQGDPSKGGRHYMLAGCVDPELLLVGVPMHD